MKNLITTIKIITNNSNRKRLRHSLAILVGLLFFAPAITYAVDACSGGTISYSGGYTYHTFTANGTLSCSSAVTADVLIVGGGGPGGSSNGTPPYGGYGAGGGGGAGGVVIANSKALSATNYSVTVGAGGTPANLARDIVRGGNSTFDTGVAVGGGWGARYGEYMAGAGGSAGGGSGYSGGGGYTFYQPSGTGGANNYGGTGYGNIGGYGSPNYGDCAMAGGAGGGAGGAGGNGGQDAGDRWVGGTPGTGIAVWGYTTVAFGGGGGPGFGGVGTTYGYYGSGGGGGGNGCDTTLGAYGVQGVVIVRYINPPTLTNVSVSPSSGSYPAGARTFTTVYRNTNGATDINYVHFLLNYGVDGNNTAFYGLYVRSTNACHIFNSDNAGGWAAQNWSANVNVSGAQSLPTVTLNSCSSSVSGNDLTVTWNLTFNSWNESLIYQYLWQLSNGGYNSGWTGPHGSSYYVIDTTIPTNPASLSATIGGTEAHLSYRNSTSPTVALSWPAGSDNLSGITNYQIVLTRSSDGAWIYAQDAGNTTSYNLNTSGLVDGMGYHYYIRAFDAAGNGAAAHLYGGTFYVDVSAPSSNSISINSGAATTNTGAVTLTLSSTDSNSGLSQMQFSCDNVNWSTAEAYATSKAFNFTNGVTGCTATEGTKTVYARFKDVAGNWSSAVSDTIVYDITAPTGTITAITTPRNTPFGTITGTASDSNLSNVAIVIRKTSTAGGCTGNSEDWDGLAWVRPCYAVTPTGVASWSYASTPNAGQMTDGTYYVYLNVADTAGNTSSWSPSQTVVYDATAPTTSGSITGGTVGSNGWYTTNVTYTLTPADATSGVASTAYCTDTSNACVPGTPGVGITLSTESATNYIRWRSTDNATNVQSTQSSGIIKIDKSTPTTSGAITAGTLGSNGWYTTNVTYTLTPADATSGVASTVYCVDTSNTCTPSTSGTSITVSAESATNYVRWRSTDNAGLVQTIQSSGAIKIDKGTPTTSGAITGGTLGSNGWYTTNVTYTLSPAAGLSGVAATYYCTDTSNTCTPTTSGTSITVSTESGTNYVRWYSVSNSGITQTTQSSGIIKIDKTTPTTSGAITAGTLGTNGWYTTNVTYTLTQADATSGVGSTVYCVDTSDTCTPTTPGTSITVSTESATNYVRWRSTDNAGLVQTTQSSGIIKIDKTTPTTTGAITAGTLGSNGWYTTNVTYTLTPADAMSGVGGTLLCSDTTNTCNPVAVATVAILSTESATNYVRWRSTDNAGLTQTVQSSGAIKIDKTAPTAPAPTDTGTSSVIVSPLTFSYASTDATSGLSQCYAQVDVNNTDGAALALGTTAIGTTGSYNFTLGVKGATYYFRYYCTDVAGLSASWSSWTDGIYIFADQAALTINNISVNYGSSLTLTTSGGSGTGAVTYAVTSAGTAGCSVGASTGVLTYTSIGTCTITATKAGDLTYNPVSSGATTITVVGIAPIVTSTTLSLVGIDRMTVGGTITTTGGYAISARGTCFGTSPAPTSCTPEGATATGTFTHVLSSLTPGTLYYVRAYATNQQGTGYSSDLATTTQNYPVVTSSTISSVGTSTATFGATLVSHGGTTITARGTCWDYTTSPTANCTAEGGTGIGVYTQARTGLPEGTLIYVRGYTSYTDGAGVSGTVYSSNASTTMIETLKVFDLSGYRFFASSTTLVPGAPLSTQNTPAMLTNGGDLFRMRLLVHLGGTNSLFQNGKQFKLQYAPMSGSCDSGFFGETYEDVSSTTPIAFYDAPTLSHNSAIGSQADLTHSGHTITNQAYVEQNTFTNSQSSIPVGQDGKFDFSLQDNGAFSNTSYCLRAVTSDGLPFASYSVIPEIRTVSQNLRVEGFRIRSDNGDAANATYISNENGGLSIPFIRGDKIRIRFSISNQGATQTLKRYQLEYSPMTISCALSSSWTAVPSFGNYSGQAFRMEPSQYVPNAVPTVDVAGLTDPQSRTFTSGIMMTSEGVTPLITLTPSQFTQIEYSIRSTANIDTERSYCFRITNSGDPSDFTYVAYPQINPISNVFRRESGGGAGVSIVSFETNATTSTTTTGGGIGGGGGSTAGTSTATTTTSTTTPIQGGGGGDVGYINIGKYLAKTNNTLVEKLKGMARASLRTPQAYAYSNPEPTVGEVTEQLLVDFFIKIDEIRKNNYMPVRR